MGRSKIGRPKKDKRHGLSKPMPKHVTKKQRAKPKKPKAKKPKAKKPKAKKPKAKKPKARRYNITKRKRIRAPPYQQLSMIRQPSKKRYSVHIPRQMPRQIPKHSSKSMSLSDSSIFTRGSDMKPDYMRQIKGRKETGDQETGFDYWQKGNKYEYRTY